MSEVIRLAVDCGKADTKVCVANKDGSISRSKFPTCVIEKDAIENGFQALASENAGNYMVTYDGKNYAVGNFVLEDAGHTDNTDSKKGTQHKIATLVAIASQVNNGARVSVAVGCPLNVFVSAKKREDYLKELLPTPRIDITINGKHKNFEIVSKVALPEAFGAVNVYPDMFKNSLVGVIDIGGLNVNNAIFDKGAITGDRCFTSKNGRRELINKVTEALGEMYPDAEFTLKDIESFIRQGYVTNHENETKDFMDNLMRSHVIALRDDCKQKHGWNIDFMNIVFIGGTSLMLEKYIKEVFAKAKPIIADNADFINAEGFVRIICARDRIILK